MNEDNKHETMDWGHFLRRKDRPLPPKGCSVAFYVFLVLLIIFLAVYFVKYSNQ